MIAADVTYAAAERSNGCASYIFVWRRGYSSSEAREEPQRTKTVSVRKCPCQAWTRPWYLSKLSHPHIKQFVIVPHSGEQHQEIYKRVYMERGAGTFEIDNARNVVGRVLLSCIGRSIDIVGAV